jgi:hypothetical protein
MNVMTGSPKTKTRSNPPKSQNYTSYNYNAAGVLQGAPQDHGTLVFSTHGESITYTTKRLNQRAKANQCNHLIETFHYGAGPAPTRLMSNTVPGWYTDYTGHHANAVNALTSTVNTVDVALGITKFGVLGAGAQTYINEAWDRLRPDLTTVSIPNFLADIEDIKKLYQLWKKSLSLAKNVAGLHLNYQYGWKPTVGDLSSLIEAVTGLRSKLAAFKSQLGRTFQGSMSPTQSLATSASGSFAYPSGSHAIHYSASCQRKLQCFIAWQPQPLAVMGPMDEVLRGLLDALGFELNPSIIWDALPFTFVIDWFFDVGSWLSRYRVDTLELPILMIDSFCQYTETLSIEWTWLRANDGTYTSRPRSGGATFNRKVFHRMPIYPDYGKLTGLGWKMPNFNQASLAVSLATVLKK